MPKLLDILKRKTEGITESQKDLAKANRQVFLRIKGASYTRWKAKSQKAWDFFLNDQLTETEVKELESAGMPTFIINKITKGVETLMYFLTANRPRFKFVGRTDEDTDIATVHSKLGEYVWDKSGGNQVAGQVIQHALTKSVGYYYIGVDPDGDRGAGEVRISHVEPYEVYPDPTARDICLRDAGFILIKKNYVKRELINRLPQFKNRILKAAGNDEHALTDSERDTASADSIQPPDIDTLMFTDDESDHWIDYYELYKKVRIPYVNMIMRNKPTPDELKEINSRIDSEIKLMQQKLSEELEDQRIALADQLKANEISKERHDFELKRMEQQINDSLKSERDGMMAKAMQDITRTTTRAVSKEEYEVFKKSEAYKDRIVDGVKYWETRVQMIVSVGNDTFLYEAELPISEYPIIAVPYLHTGTPYPMSNVQLVVGKQRELNKAHQILIHNASLGSSLRWKYKVGAVDVKYWEENVTAPGAMLPVLGNMDDVREVVPQPPTTAFIGIVEKGEGDVEEQMGALPFMTGKLESPYEPARGVMARDEFGTRRIRAWMTNVVEPALELLAKVFTEFAQDVYTSHKVFRIVDPTTSETETNEINVPMYDRLGNVIGKFKDYASLQFDVKIVSGSTLPVYRHQELQERMDMFKEGIIDDIAVLEKTDITNKERIVQRKSLMAQAQARVAELEDQMKRLKGTNETLERQVVQAGISGEVKDFGAETRKAMADFKAQLAAIISETKAQQKIMLARASVELDEAKREKKK